MSTVIKRDPLLVGDHQWGCHYELSDEMAAVAENNGYIYREHTRPLNEDLHRARVAAQSGRWLELA